MKILIGNWINNHLTEKRLLYILIAILVITTAADMFSAMRLPIFRIAESNPIYVLTGSTMPLIFLNIFVVIWYSRSLKNSISIPKIFIFCMMALYLSIGHGFGIYSNITAGEEYQKNPEGFIEDVQAITPKEKIQAYGLLVGIVMVMPIIISFVAFTIAMYFYGKRQPKRDKITHKIYKLSKKLESG